MLVFRAVAGVAVELYRSSGGSYCELTAGATHTDCHLSSFDFPKCPFIYYSSQVTV